jgi:hypothetical protein
LKLKSLHVLVRIEVLDAKCLAVIKMLLGMQCYDVRITGHSMLHLLARFCDDADMRAACDALWSKTPAWKGRWLHGVDMVDPSGCTALGIAIDMAKRGAAETLLEYGASVDVKYRFALFCIATSKWSQTDMLLVYTRNGENIYDLASKRLGVGFANKVLSKSQTASTLVDDACDSMSGLFDEEY